MALSGSFTTTAYSNRSLTFSWSATQSVSGNYSDISWSLKGSGSQSQYFKAAPFKVVIDGEQVYYSENRIQLLNGTLVASGTKRINHNTDGSRSFSASVVAAIYSYANNVSGSGSWSLDSIPRAATITGANSITDEGNPYFTFSNAAGYTDLVAELEINPVNTHLFSRSISNTGSYTFELTDEERATLRSYLANTNSATLRYLLYSNSKNFVSYVDKTINVVNATPTFTSSVKDTEGASTVLTGSTAGNVSMIKGFNYMACSMEATAYKGASITKYKITNGANAVEAAAADFNNTESNTFKFEVWDSRGNYNSYTTTIPMIDYIPLTCNVDGKIVLSTSDSTKATVSFTAQGNCFKGNFGAIDNTLALDYTVADTEGNIAANDVVEIALNSNTYSIDIDVEDLDYRKSYVVYVKARDAIKSMQANSKTLKAIPIFDWGESDFNFNVDVTFKGKSLVDLIYPIGSIYMSVNYFEPSTIFGGEWERLMDKFLLGSGAVYVSGQEGGKSSVTLSAAIGATNSSTHALGYIADGYSNFQAGRAPTYTVYGSTSTNGGTWNHSTPVTEYDSTSRSVNIMPPYLTVNMWKRVA